ncbi:lachesin [Bacillus rossius redtenbacheri]|uniref:lachesin n=1 Tax=Bacillus rossius redtenbacheri TaxID=93214 RepID=UPI002FDD8D9B
MAMFTRMSIFILMLCLCGAAWGQRTPTISYISQLQIKDIGGVVELECSVQYAQDYPVLWMKIDQFRTTEPLPISTGSALIIRDSRFALQYETASSTYTLQIKDIQETDAGFYQCQVIIALNNKISAEVELQVRRPPIISDNSTRSLVVSEMQSVKLECYANGYPEPRISWRRENNAVLPTGGSIYRGNVLKISAVRKEDRGTYYCVAENGVGRGARRNIAVEVEFSPVITVPKPRIGQALQFDMDLECHVEAYPPPAVVWLKDDVQLSNNQHYSISHFATADEFTDTTIRVITIEKRQYGMYICKAANKLGTVTAEVELFETIIPVCPPACGQARYGDAAQITTSMALVLISVLLVFLHRNFHTKH